MCGNWWIVSVADTHANGDAHPNTCTVTVTQSEPEWVTNSDANTSSDTHSKSQSDSGYNATFSRHNLSIDRRQSLAKPVGLSDDSGQCGSHESRTLRGWSFDCHF
jgi:hypothetical protein